MSLLRFDFNQEYLTFDFETSALNLVSTDITVPWSLGYSLHKYKHQQFTKERYLYWPDTIDIMRTWGREAAYINRFNEEEYISRAEDPSFIISDFIPYLDNENIISVSANGYGFDYAMHKIVCARLGIKPNLDFLNRHVDIQIIEKAKVLSLPIPQVGTDEFRDFSIKLSEYHERNLKTNLKLLCNKYGVLYNEGYHHQACEDIRMTFDIFLAMIHKYDIYKSW